MAIAINGSIISKSEKSFAKVELSGEHTRGQMVRRRWTGHAGRESVLNVCIVTDLDFDDFFQMLEACCK